MKSADRPLAVLFGSFTHAGILTFVGRQGYIEWDWEPEILISVLMNCNGYLTVKQIASEINKPTRFTSKMLSLAEEYGIVVEVNSFYKLFSDSSRNPNTFGSEISSSKIEKIHSSDLPYQPGAVSISVDSKTNIGFQALLNKRTSSRSFMQSNFTTKELTNLLHFVYSREGVPSAGDLRPIIPYIYLFRNTDTLVAGLYEYRWNLKQLFLTEKQPTILELKRAFPEEFLFENALCLICFVADLNRSCFKYGNRGYRYSILEAGHASQNLYLWAAETDNGALEYGGYLDQELSTAIGLSSGVEVLTTMFIGKPQKEVNNPTSNKDKLQKLKTRFLGKTKKVKKLDSISLDKQVSFRSYALSEYEQIDSSIIKTAWGSGTNLYEAQLKALVESVERYYSGDIRVDRECSANELACSWLDPRIIAPLSKAQYNLHKQLKPFDPNRVIQWVKGQYWKSSEPVFVPIDLVYYPINSEKIRRELVCYASSNGIAAHTSAKLALENGLLELIERDAFVRAWYAGSPNPQQIEIEILSRQEIASYVDKYRSQGVDVSFSILETGKNVAVVVCMMKQAHKFGKLGVGAGASFVSYEQACEKAFYEAEASWLTCDSSPKKKTPKRFIVEPEDHLQYYQFSGRQQVLSPWFSFAKQSTLPKVSGSIDSYDPVTVNLFQSSDLHVVRVIEASLVPITFGYGLEHYRHSAFQKALNGRPYKFPGRPHCFA